MKTINWTQIKNYVGKYGDWAAYGAAAVLAYAADTYLKKGIERRLERAYPVGYNDAVKAVLDSSMFSSDMTAAITAIKTGCDTEQYKAVIHIVNGSAFSSDKVKMIKKVFEN